MNTNNRKSDFMQAIAYEGYFEKGIFYSAGNIIQIPEKSRVVITILENTQEGEYANQTAEATKTKRILGFVDVPPLPDSFFDPLPEEELELWGL